MRKKLFSIFLFMLILISSSFALAIEVGDTDCMSNDEYNKLFSETKDYDFENQQCDPQFPTATTFEEVEVFEKDTNNKNTNDEVLKNENDTIKPQQPLTETTTQPTTTNPNQNTTTQPVQKETINPANFNEKFSYTNFSKEEIEIIDLLLTNYYQNRGKGLETLDINLPFAPTPENYYNITSFLFMYFGDVNGDIRTYCFNLTNVGGETGIITICFDKMDYYMQIKEKNDIKIRQNLSSIEMGTEKEILMQIAEQMANDTNYVDGKTSVNNLLYENKATCNAFSLTFARYCQMLGIKCDICIGTINGSKHAWNKVTYSDGNTEYFDITYYNSTNNKSAYLGTKNSPFAINSTNIYY